jgi:hypothetical protein
VAHGRDRLGLLAKAWPTLVVGQKLDSDVACELHVAGSPDLAHPTRTDLTEQLIALIQQLDRRLVDRQGLAVDGWIIVVDRGLIELGHRRARPLQRRTGDRGIVFVRATMHAGLLVVADGRDDFGRLRLDRLDRRRLVVVVIVAAAAGIPDHVVLPR